MSDPLQELADLVADAHERVRADLEMGIGHRPAGAPIPVVPDAPRSRPAPRSVASRQSPAAAPAPTAPGARAQGPSKWDAALERTAPVYGLDHAVGAWGFQQADLPPLPEGSSARAAADRLVDVRTELGECRRCRLCEERRKIVFGMGNPNADLVVLGEGPGANEDASGLPFVGAAGEMLDKMLELVLGLSRSQVYILNVVKCRPPRNRNPAPEEVAACSPFLVKQLEAIQPKVILPLGSPAVKTLLDTTRGITQMRGTWHLWRSVPVMPTFHPAYLLRQPKDKRYTFDDLKAVRARYDELGGAR